MASLLITKADDKNNTIVTINGKGVFYQELRLGDRPMSARVRLGKLVVVDDEIVVEFDAWCEYDALLAERNTLEKTRNAAKDVIKSLEGDAVSRKQTEIEQLTGAIARLEKRINEHPIRQLTVLNAKVMSAVDKMLDKVRHRHKSIETTDKTVQFTHHPSKEYFLEKQATELLTRHNEKLESRGIDEGYLDFDASMEIVTKRFAKVEKKAPTPKPDVALTKVLVDDLESSIDKAGHLKRLDSNQVNALAKHYQVSGSKAAKIAAIAKLFVPATV
jgi:hypothetical protein